MADATRKPAIRIQTKAVNILASSGASGASERYLLILYKKIWDLYRGKECIGDKKRRLIGTTGTTPTYASKRSERVKGSQRKSRRC